MTARRPRWCAVSTGRSDAKFRASWFAPLADNSLAISIAAASLTSQAATR